MMWDIKSYVKGCDKCQRTKAHRNKPNAPLQPHDAPSKPWEVVSVDLIWELPESAGYNAICIFVDHFSKQIHAVPTNTSLTAAGTAQLYRDHIFRLHGWPRKFIHDRGTQFESRFMKEFYKLLNIEGNPSTAYHPQTDGQTEHINQEIEQYLRIFINFHQNNWSDWLALVEFSYNDKVHSATGYSPFFINHGAHPYKGVEPHRKSHVSSVDEFVDKMKLVREEAEAALKNSTTMMKKYYDQKRGKSLDYKEGDSVWLEGKNIKTLRPMQKLGDKRYGPFKILKKVGATSFKLDLPGGWRKIHPVFNEVLLSPYHSPQFPSQQQRLSPPPVVIGEEPEWEVESILQAKVSGRGKVSYLVQFKGYPEPEWLPPENLYNATDEVAKFYCKVPNAPKPTSATVKKKLYICLLLNHNRPDNN